MSCPALSFSSLVCGAWSVPMMSIVPSLIACQSASTCAGGTQNPKRSGPSFSTFSQVPKKHRPGIDFAAARPPFIFGAAQHRHSFRRGHVENMQPGAERFLHAKQRAIAVSQMMPSYSR